jgi:hypothetical protein
MSIVLLVLAVLLAFVAFRQSGSGVRKLLLALGAGAAVIALYLAVTDPALAWNLHMVGRLALRMAGPLLRHAIH